MINAGSNQTNNHSSSSPAWLDWAPFTAALVLMLVASRATLQFWWWEYTAPESYYSHALIVPGLIAFILWAHRERIKAVDIRPSYAAAAATLVMVVINQLAVRARMESIMSYSLAGILVFSAWAMFGGRLLWQEKIAALFLLAMLPLPGPLLNDMTFGLQRISTNGATWLLNHTGFPSTQIGYEIHMQDFVMFVDVPCSGFKTLIALLTFNAFFAYLLDASTLKRLELFLIAAPLSIGVNVLRISLIGVVGECISNSAAHIFHDYSGLITLVIGILTLLGLARILGCRKFAGMVIY
jgi:exosortase